VVGAVTQEEVERVDERALIIPADVRIRATMSGCSGWRAPS
jgi:hypothetical protein